LFDPFWQLLQDSRIATAIREGELLFPWIECFHVLALSVVVGSIAFVDLRLIGVAARDRSVAQTTRSVLPVTWSAFIAAVITGGLLFSSNATMYAHNIYFQVKIGLIVAAGANMSLYHLFLDRGSELWTTAERTPLRARLTGVVSLGLWVTIVACGRWIGFTINALS